LTQQPQQPSYGQYTGKLTLAGTTS